ncbi:MAG TPA: chromosome segregation protein SMC [Acidobacteriota bacterium]|nr:chromosome segregation protein SMC [Acidobacteriota bacterium]
MNQIKKLELVGFKSFCDRTHIPFNEGVTAIVGPNGCGKSNIADAISWVVGEQSAKSLRTDKMEGVIFNGTQARKPTGFAEVVLTLSLSNPIEIPGVPDLNAEEFTVGRRLYRSGDSEYYLDGRRCRLKDIQALFEGTGLGPNSYAILEQGRIGQILSSKPAERRALIEEAARITLFKSRRYSAEMKLEQAQQNLVRAQDIIREVVRQLNSLRRQAAKARRYGRLRDELRAVQRLKIGMEERQIRARLTECSDRFIQAQEQEHAILAELAAMEHSRENARKACDSCEEAVNQTREKLSSLKTDAGNAQNMLENQETQKLGLIARSGELDRELKAIEERGQLVQHEIERLTNSSHALGSEIAIEQQSLESERAKSDVLQDAIGDTETKIDDLRSFLLTGAGRLSDLKNLQARCMEGLDRISARASRLENESQVKFRERGDLIAQLDKVRSEYGQKAQRQKEVASSVDELEATAARLATTIDRVSEDLTVQVNEHSLMQHRYSSLEEVERRRSNYSEGVQKYLSTRIPGEELLPAKTLADHIETDPAYEAAMEDYLNDPLQYIIVDDRDDAVHGVERLKRIGAGKCTFMTLRNGHSRHSFEERPRLSGDGVVGYLDDLLHMSEDVKAAFERALPEFASTIMVSDLNTAFRVGESTPGASFLTLSGESYSTRGTLSAVGERKSMAGFLALKREKRELERKLSALGDKIQATREELARLKHEQAVVAESLKALSAEARKLEVDTALTAHEMAKLQGEIEKIGQEESVANTELEQLKSEKQDFEAKLEQAAAQIGEIEKRSGTGSEELAELNARLQSLRTESAEHSKQLGTLLSAHAVKQERRSAMETDLKRLAAELDDVHNRNKVNRSEAASAVERIAELEIVQQEVRVRIEDCNRAIQETAAALEERLRELSAERTSLASFEEKLRHLHGSREEAMNVRSKIEIEKTRLESDFEHLERSCQEEFRMSIAETVTDIPDTEWQREYDEVSQSHDRLREVIENFGAINMRALEEYKELDQRYQFLNGQRLDIEKSIADTQKAILEINRRSVEQFQEAFDAIRKNFQETFQLLFAGGQCDLKLLDDTDVLESGIDIIAQPPGKRLQNVLLLSGGEKALTALALLIAIFRFRPSPLCVLDEVDAPLDDANVNRFTRLLAELSKDTQFIIITHNKNTMEIAQTLYGVTMEEAGVSKIIGVDFRHQQIALAS